MSKDNLNSTERELRRVKAEYMLRYGVEIDEWSAIMIAENQRQFGRMRDQLEINLTSSRMLHEKFKGGVKTIQFGSKVEAFVYGIAISLPYAVSGLVLGIMFYVYHSTRRDHEQIAAFAGKYENIFEYQALIEYGRIEQHDGISFLILQPSKDGKYTFGESYQFDSKRKVVKVPLKSQK